MLEKSLPVLVLMLGLSLSSNLFSADTSKFKISKINFYNKEGGICPTSDMLFSVLGIREDVEYANVDISNRIREVEKLLNYKVLSWEIVKRTKILNIKITEKMVVSSVEFKGNSLISSPDILENLGFKIVGNYYEDVHETIVKKVAKFYADRGFHTADIKLEIEPLEDGTINIILKISEGKQTLISNIELEIEDLKDVDNVKKILGLKIGDPAAYSYIHGRIKKLRKHLYSKGYYSHVIYRKSIEIDPDFVSGAVRIGVRTGSKFKISFVGNDTFKGVKRLKGALDITETDILSKDYYPVLVKKLEDFYKGFGFKNVQVKVEEEIGLRPGELCLIFVINEGGRTYLGDINFITKKVENRSKIETYIKETKKDFLDKGFFVRQELEDLKKLIKKFLNQEGYLRARVTDVSFTARRKNVIDVDYEINEGQGTLIRSIEVKGNSDMTTQKILNTVGISKNDLFRIKGLSEGINKLVHIYRERGYIDFKVDREKILSYSEDFRFVDIAIDIVEGEKYKIGKIVFVGLVKTKEKVVRRELKLDKGDRVDLDLLQETENAIASLGIFGSVSVILLPVSKLGSGYRDVLVKVEEKKAGSYEVGFGYRTDDGVTVFSGISYNNLGGWNRRISASGSISRRLGSRFQFIEYDVNTGYYEPYLFNIPFDFRVNINFKKDDLPDYDKRKLDFAFYFEKRFHSHSLSLRNAFERVKIFNASVAADNAQYWKYSIRQLYRFDSRDSILNPTRGINFFVYIEWGHSLQSLVMARNYLKIAERIKFYKSFLKNWVFVSSLGSGYVKGFDGGILIDERFAIGGTGSIRGFRAGIINDMTTGLFSQYYYTFSLELRRLLFWRLVGSVFYDIGNISSDNLAIPGPFSSIGVGISIRFAVGALSLEYGYVYDRDKRIPPDKVGRLHLSLGTF